MESELKKTNNIITDRAILISAIALAPNNIIGLMRWFESGWKYSYLFYSIILIGLLLLGIFRKKLHIHFKTSSLFALYCLIGVATLSNFGFINAPYYILISIAIVSILFHFRKKITFNYLLLFSISYLVLGIGFCSYVLEPGFNERTFSYHVLQWKAVLINSTGFGAVFILTSGMLFKQLAEAILVKDNLARELNNNKEQLQTLSNSIPNGFFYQVLFNTKTNNPNLTYISAGVQNAHNVSQEDVLSDPATLLNQIHEDDIKYVKKQWQHASENVSTFKVEARFISPTGKLSYRQLSSEPNRISKNEIIWNGISLDITQRKLAEIALITNDQQHKTAQRIAKIGHWNLDIVNNELTWSDEVYRIFGLQPQEFTATYEAFLERVHPDDRKKVNSAYLNSLETKKQYEITHRIVLRNGIEKTVTEQCHTTFDKDGKPLFSIGTVQDVTEKTKTENKLIENEKELQNIFDSSPSIMISLNEKAEIMRMNRTGLEFIGTSFENIRNKQSGEALLCITSLQNKKGCGHSSKCKNCSIRNAIDDTLLNNTPRYNIDTELRVAKDNEEVKYNMLLSTILISERPEKKILAVLVDVSERKKMEHELEQYRNHLEELVKYRTKELNQTNEMLLTINKELERAFEKLKETQTQLIQSEKMASLGVLTAGVAHEMNNPLNYIKSGMYGLESLINEGVIETSSPEEQEKVLKAMTIGIERATKIVKSLNTFSHKGGDTIKKFDIHEVIDTCLVMLNHELKNKCIVNKDYTYEKFCLNGNKENFHQVFINILMNSIQAIKDDGKISIKTRISANNNNLCVTVSDNGEGISNENLKKIFDPFFTTKDPGKGTGLGLSIAYKIIEDHNGKIEYNSVIDQGTEVIIELPTSTNYEYTKQTNDSLR